jgi:hypothetical protein
MASLLPRSSKTRFLDFLLLIHVACPLVVAIFPICINEDYCQTSLPKVQGICLSNLEDNLLHPQKKNLLNFSLNSEKELRIKLIHTSTPLAITIDTP